MSGALQTSEAVGFWQSDLESETAESLCSCGRRVRWTNYYPATMIIAVLYLALLADGMMQAAEKAGCLAGVPDDLMGLTVTAAGTSLPNLFASVLVARQVGSEQSRTLMLSYLIN